MTKSADDLQYKCNTLGCNNIATDLVFIDLASDDNPGVIESKAAYLCYKCLATNMKRLDMTLVTNTHYDSMDICDSMENKLIKHSS